MHSGPVVVNTYQSLPDDDELGGFEDDGPNDLASAHITKKQPTSTPYYLGQAFPLRFSSPHFIILFLVCLFFRSFSLAKCGNLGILLLCWCGQPTHPLTRAVLSDRYAGCLQLPVCSVFNIASVTMVYEICVWNAL